MRQTLKTLKNSDKSPKIPLDTLSPPQIKRLEEELAQFPDFSQLSHYKRKKIASVLSKEFCISEQVLQSWIKLKIKQREGRPTSPVESLESKPEPPHLNSEVEAVRSITDDNEGEDGLQIIESKNCRSRTSNESPTTPKENVDLKVEDVGLHPNEGTPGYESLKKNYEKLKKKFEKKFLFCESLKEKCQDLMETFKTYSAEKEEKLNNLQHKLSVNEKELEDFKKSETQRISQAENRISALQKQLEEKSLTVAAAEQKLSSMESLLRDKQEECSELQEERIQMVEFVKKYKKPLHVMKEQEANLKNARAEREELKKRLKILEEDCRMKDTQFAKEILIFKESSYKLGQELDFNKKKLKETSELKLQLEEANKSLMTEVSNFINECNGSKQKTFMLENNLQEITADLNRSLEKQKFLEAELEEKYLFEEEYSLSLQHQLRSAEKRLKDSKALVTKTTEEKILVQLKLDKLIQENKLILESNKNLINNSNKEISQKNSEILELQKSLKVHEQNISQKNSFLADLTDDLRAKNIELQCREKEIVELSQKVYETKEENKLLISKIHTLEMEVEMLKSKNVAQKNDFDREIELKYREEITKLNKERLELKQELEFVNHRLLVLAEEKQKLVDQLCDARLQVCKVKGELPEPQSDFTKVVVVHLQDRTETNRGCKRKLGETVEPCHKRQRYNQQKMIGYSWPLQAHREKKWICLTVQHPPLDNEIQSLLKDRNERSFREAPKFLEREKFGFKQIEYEDSPMLMLTHDPALSRLADTGGGFRAPNSAQIIVELLLELASCVVTHTMSS